MNRFTKIFTLFFMVLYIVTRADSVEAAERVPFCMTVLKIDKDKIASIEFVANRKLELFIGEKESKEVIYSDTVEEKVEINGLELGKKYSMTVTIDNGKLYTGNFELYTKPESDFKGVLLDVEEVLTDKIKDVPNERNVREGSPVDYEKESNNFFRKANKINGHSIFGKINKKRDVDYFKTTFSEKGDAIFVLDQIPEGKDYDLYVYNSSKKQIASSCGMGTETIILKSVPLNEWYYIKVIGEGGSYDKEEYYRLTVNLTPKETEVYGHSFDTAKVSTVLQGTPGKLLSKGDNCYFKFTPKESGNYRIYSTGTTDTYGTLYDKEHSKIMSNDDKPNDIYGNFELKCSLDKNITYVIEVKHYSSGVGEFQLYIESLIEDTHLDNEEDNKLITNKENPMSMMSNKVYINEIPSKYFETWYEFKVSETGSYKFEGNDMQELYIEWFEENKEDALESVKGKESTQLARTLMQGKKYYIKVSGKALNRSSKIYKIGIEKLELPSDLEFNKQWGLMNYINGKDSNVIPAWECTKGRGFKIGVADNGVYYNHIDLKENIDESLAYNFIHDTKDVYPENEKVSPAAARTGHGTHVAGIIAAKENNKGIVGVAPESKIIPLKVLGSRIPDYEVYNGSIAAFIKSIDYAKEHGIKLMNCSFGGNSPAVSEKQAMLEAEDILFVIAAGNSGNNLSKVPEYPACYYHDNSLVVAAINIDGEIAEFSNYGGPTEIAAPGDQIYSTYPEDEYAYNSGTSMATPIVSSICGLVWSKNSKLTPVEVKQIVIDEENITLLDSLKNKVLSGGLINAFKAVTNEPREKRCMKNVEKMGRDIKKVILKYHQKADEDEKTNQLIVKFSKEVNIDEWIQEIKEKYEFQQINKIDYLSSINAYVFELANISEVDGAVKMFNGEEQIIYAEPNYLREER